MVKGSCNCGDWAYEYEGEPAANVLCHCIPCRKTAGSNGSTNTIVPDGQFKQLSGKTKNYTRKGISGKNVTYHMCDNCGCIVIVKGEALAGVTIVKTGTIDDKNVLDKYKLGTEIFTKDRPDCIAAIEGIEQKEVA